MRVDMAALFCTLGAASAVEPALELVVFPPPAPELGTHAVHRFEVRRPDQHSSTQKLLEAVPKHRSQMRVPHSG